MAIELKRILDKLVETDADSVLEVLISRSNIDIANINLAYANFYQRSLRSEIESKYFGSVENLLSQLSKGARTDNSSPVDSSLVNKDVADLYNAGEGMVGTDEDVFVNIYAARSFNHLNAIYATYASQYGKTMESVIRSEFSGNIEGLLLDIISYSKNKVSYLAERLHYTMAGAQTLDHSLMRLIVGRCEIDLGDVKVEYQKLYGRSLASDVSSDTSRDYKRALLALIG